MNNAGAYWKKNRLYISILLSIWATVSFLLSIVFVDELDNFYLGPFKLGFWISQQGSIYAFVLLIYTYIFLMNRLDKQYFGRSVPERGGEQ